MDASYSTPISTEAYGYTDSSWKDLLTSYNGTAITYDAIGNPLSYNNGQSYTFTWENGRQLASAAVGGKTVTFEYNASGIRTEKHLANTHDVYYRLIGDRVVEMVIDSTRGIERLVFIYDDSGAPYGIRYYEGYNDTVPAQYTFMLNLQGDVVRILDCENGIVANYVYDAWGNILAITDADGEEITHDGHIANLNPIRYRGYMYDTETGLYYCNSRYYDPIVGRFVNADAYTSTGQGFGGFNMFAYCQNNPAMFVDPNGEDAIWIYYAERAEFAGIYFGHTALLIQNRFGGWSYFSWGANSTTDKKDLIFGTEAAWKFDGHLCFAKISNINDVRSLLSLSNDKEADQDVTDYIYIEGDFSKSYDYIFSLKVDMAKYKLLSLNCVQACATALSYGSFDKNNSDRKIAMLSISGISKPSTAFYTWKSFDEKIDEYNSANWFKRFFMPNPWNNIRIRYSYS